MSASLMTRQRLETRRAPEGATGYGRELEATARATTGATSVPLGRQSNVLLAILLALDAGCWWLLVRQPFTGSGLSQHSGVAASLTMGMGFGLFLALWVTMMAAMMFPAAAPMILMFARLQSSRRAVGRPSVPTAFFVGSYLAVWATSGALAFAGAIVVGGFTDTVPVLQASAPRIAGAVLVLAGVYQLTPLKTVCLRHCRSPLSFVVTHWREGRAGSTVMGLQHGGFCLGCCWLLLVMLFPLGVMNVAAMGVLTLIVFAEKVTPWGIRIARALGLGLIACGIVVTVLPWLLPGSAIRAAMSI